VSVRKDFEALLTSDWAEIPALSGVRVLATEAPLDEVERPTALIRIKSVERHPQAPQGAFWHGFTLHLISSHFDPDRAADQLEELLEAVLDYFKPRPLFKYEQAEFGLATESNLAYLIPISVTAVATAPEPLEG
jgi:hypothetical protein